MNLYIVVCRKRYPASWMPKKEMPVAASLLRSIILSVKRVVLVITPLRVIEEEILFFSVLLDILNADHAVQSIFKSIHFTDRKEGDYVHRKVKF